MANIVKVVILCLTLTPPMGMAGNMATCILDRMPGAQNQAVAQSVMMVCQQQYPAGMDSIPVGDGRGWFGYSSGAECTIAKAATTPLQRAAGVIAAACHRLYDEPPKPKETDPFADLRPQMTPPKPRLPPFYDSEGQN